MELNTQKDKRRNYRFLTKTGSFAKIDKFKQGPIVDISKNGLAFRYIDLGNKIEICPNQTLRLTISYQEDFMLKSLPCGIVENHCPLPKKNLSSGNMYKCRVKFEDLTKEQILLLNHFINKFTHNKSA